MVVHQAIMVQVLAEPALVTVQQVQEVGKVLVHAKQHLAVVTSVHEVVIGAVEMLLAAWDAGHRPVPVLLAALLRDLVYPYAQTAQGPP